MHIAATVLTLALFPIGGGSPAPTPRVVQAAECVAPEHTGTFRVVAASASATGGRPGLFVLENIGGCLEAMYITDDAAPAVIDGLSLNGDTLKGALRTSKGVAKVSLRFTGASLAGSIIQGREEWRVEGKRTS